MISVFKTIFGSVHCKAGFACLLFLLGTLLTGCFVPIQESREEVQNILIWPPPPQPTRITFLKEIVFPRDIRRKTGWWSSVKEFIFGKNLPFIVRPYGLTVDENDNLLIADPGIGLVHIYNLQDGTYRRLPGEKDDLVMLSPIDVDLDSVGRVYVSDSAAKKVYVFDNEGKLEKTMGEFLRPTGLAVNKALSRIYVVDTMGHRVRAYGTNGKHLFDFGQRGKDTEEFNYPTNISLDREGNVYITDAMNFRVHVFDQDGHYLYDFGRAGDGPGTFSKPRGLGVDSEGHIYVVDALFNNVQIMNSEGQPFLFFGKPGVRPGEFSLPAGLFIDDRDRIFVADSFNQRIQVFQYVKRKKEFSQTEKMLLPSSILMLSRQGGSAFLIDKSTSTLSQFQMGTDEIRLVRSYSIETEELDRVKEGLYFGIQQDAVAHSIENELLLSPAFESLDEVNDSDPMILRWGKNALKPVMSRYVRDAYLIIREDLTAQDQLASAFAPFLVQEQVDYLPPKAVKGKLREILKVTNSWKKSWESLEVEPYIQFYSHQFRHENMDRDAWKLYKTSIFSNRKESEVTLRPLYILESGPYVILSFLQSDQSDVDRDEGIKKLLIRKERKEWKIIREVWTRYDGKI